MFHLCKKHHDSIVRNEVKIKMKQKAFVCRHYRTSARWRDGHKTLIRPTSFHLLPWKRSEQQKRVKLQSHPQVSVFACRSLQMTR